MRESKLREIIKILLILQQYIYQVIQCGTITPTASPPPIYNSLANAGVRADYQFSFIPENFLPSGGFLQIIFPSQYDKTSAFLYNNLICNVPCTANELQLTFTFPYDLAAGIPQIVTVNQVLNPQKKGGVGSFILKTLQGQNVVDQNLIFGIIGIANVSTSLISSTIDVDPSGSDKAGDYTSYQLTFSTTNDIPPGSYFILSVPTDFILSDYPTCLSPSLNGYFIAGKLQCSRQDGNKIRIDGVVGILKSLINYRLSFSMQNPPYSIDPNTASITNYSFSFFIYKQGTQILFESIYSIPGPKISPSGLNNVSLYQTDLINLNNRYKYAEYQLKFTSTLPLNYGNWIVIEFPAYFQIMVNMLLTYEQENMTQLHYVKYGLDNISEQNRVNIYKNTISGSTNQILISNFDSQKFIQEISVIIMTRNPDAAGTTTPLKIRIYKDSTLSTLIAEDVTSATAYIEDYLSCDHSKEQALASINNYYRYGFTFQNAMQTVIPFIMFEFKPLKTIPIGGLIKVRIPSEFSFNPAFPTTASDCKIYFNNAETVLADVRIHPTIQQRSNLPQPPVSANSFNCKTTFDSDVMTISGISSTLFGSTGQIHAIYLQNWVISPSRNATYFFDFTSYDSDQQTILESWKDPYQINPKIMSSTPIVSLINNYKSSGTSIQKSILDIQFMTDINIPDGQQIYKATDTQGYIQLDFRTISGGTWIQDLGMGLDSGSEIPCRGIQGIMPIQGSSITCTYVLAQYLLSGTTSLFPQIFIKNFVSISANTQVRIHIPNILNPQGGGAIGEIQMSIVANTNNLYQVLTSKQMTVSLLGVGPSSFTSISGLSYTSNYVGERFDLSFESGITPAANDLILIQLPSYADGFISQEQTISCSINNVNLYCIPYYKAEMILIVVSSALPNNSVIKITNLKWPYYQSSFSSSSSIDLYQINSGNSVTAKKFNNLNQSQPNYFTEASIIIPKKGLKYVDCSFDFLFTTNANIPELSLIQIQFPSNYNLLGSTPLPTVTQSGLKSYSSSNPLSISFTIQQITISNNEGLSKGQTFKVKVQGVKNPSDMPVNGISSGWSIKVVRYDEVKDITNIILQQLNFFSFNFDPAFTPGKIVFNSISAFPLNADETATYTLQFTPQTDIPIKGIIQITFPQVNFKSLPSPPDCTIGGAVTTFSSCTLSGSTFSIVIENKYNSGSGFIKLSITNINNPDQGETDGFLIQTSYDGVTLDITDESNKTGRTITTVQRSPPITVNSVTFDPKNISEQSTYTFNFITNDIITQTMQLLFQFPIQYDPLLGNNIKCQILSGIIGNNYSCYVQNRGVYLQSFDSYQPSSSNPITVQIYGITNPNVAYQNTDYLKIALLYRSDDKFINSSPEAAKLQMYSEPGWLSVSSITPSHQKVRYSTSYAFNFQIDNKVPKILSKGSIFIDFPPEFDNISDGRVGCTTSTTSFAPVIDCSVTRNRFSVTGNTEDYSGNLSVSLASVLNPTYQGYTNNFYVSSYDGINQVIIDRSFVNLDPFSFQYLYPGPLIHVNNDNQINLYPGTQTYDLFVTFDEPAQLELSIKPNILPGFKVIPFNIPIHLGQTSIPFRISCPQQIISGNYQVEWVTLGEDVPPLYTPIQKSKITILDPTKNLISMKNILDIPYGGTSLETIFSMVYASDIGVEVTMNLASQYQGIRLDKTNLNFTKGVNELSFRVISDPSVTLGTAVSRGSVIFQLHGIDEPMYQLQYTQMYFNLIAADSIPPVITQLTTLNKQKNSITINIRINEPAMVYYMVSLNGTDVPPFIQVQTNSTPPYNTTQSQYGSITVDRANKDFYFNLTHLTAQTPYVLHLYVQDRGNNLANPTSLTFVTASNQCNLIDIYIRNHSICFIIICLLFDYFYLF